MLKKLISIALSITFLGSSMPSAFAEPVQIPVDCVCVDKEYKVYGEEQPEKQSNRNESGEREESCFVTVDLEAVIDEDDVEGAGEEGGLGAADRTGASSLVSPLQVLFEQSRVKQAFVRLLGAVFQGHTEKYHAFLDKEIFGQAIAFVSGFETSKDLEEYLKEQEGECRENDDQSNPKPNCVIERALCSYEKYVGVLFHQSGQSLISDAIETEETIELFAILQNRDQALVEEATQAQQALDTAIAVYAQFFQTYRLHLRFKELIVHLARVRNLTSHMRTLVSCIPNKFVGVATTKCN